MTNEPLLTTAQAAKFLGISKAFLERDRWKGATIPFHRIGTRAVRYQRSDLDDFIRNARCAKFSLEARVTK